MKNYPQDTYFSRIHISGGEWAYIVYRTIKNSMATQNQVIIGINYDTCTQWRMKNDRAEKRLVIWKKVLDILREKKAGSEQHLQYSLFLKFKGFPGGAVVESPPANAGDTGSSPGLGRSHMPRSNQAREPQLLSLRVWSLCSPTREAVAVKGPRTATKSGPHSPQLEKALAQKRRPNTAINKINK